MPLAFRNLTIQPSDPVDTWPTEAVQTALERGDLEQWRRLAFEIGGTLGTDRPPGGGGAVALPPVRRGGTDGGPDRSSSGGG